MSEEYFEVLGVGTSATHRITERGFARVDFVDANERECSLQQSSAAVYTEPGSSYVWLGCDKNAPPHLGHEMSPRMHLNRDQVAALIKWLQEWLDMNRFTSQLD